MMAMELDGRGQLDAVRRGPAFQDASIGLATSLVAHAGHCTSTPLVEDRTGALAVQNGDLRLSVRCPACYLDLEFIAKGDSLAGRQRG